MDTKNEFSVYLQNVSLFVLAALFFLFPLAFSNLTTEPFGIPKQAVLAAGALLSLSLLSIRMIVEGKVRITRSPFDLPIVLFISSLFLSAIFSVNKADAFIAFVVALFAAIVYFTTLNTARDKNPIIFLVASLLVGASVTSLLSILAFLNIYILPYPFASKETFTPLGTLLDQAIYLATLAPVAIYFIVWMISPIKQNLYKNDRQNRAVLAPLFVVPLIILTGLIITVYQLMYRQGANILPFETGFQTAFASISQDTGRTLESFLFGSGVGTYSVDFSRFKQISFNEYKDLWSLTFFRSSSFVLELLATVGIVGLLSFLSISAKVVKLAKNSLDNPLFISVLLIFAAVFVLPFSFVTQVLLFILLALFGASETVLNKKQAQFFYVDLQIVTLRKGLLAIESTAGKKNSFKDTLLPVLLAIIVFAFVLGTGYYSLQYVLSDLSFQRSIIAASQNKGDLTYREQLKAISQFPYRDAYYRVHSQTNLALANSLGSQIKPGETPSQQTQRNITNLIQQSINSARTATVIAPLNSVNWQNLSSIYRSLINFGQNADRFAIATQQQAIILDPNNPLQYLTLGGIYYQLESWDEAQNQFQIAIRLKVDLPNSYYNLGSTLEKKADIQGALEQYEIVKRLVINDLPSLKQITSRINDLTRKEKEEKQEVVAEEGAAQQEKGLLEIDQPSSSLPRQEPQVEIPPPATSPARIQSQGEQ